MWQGHGWFGALSIPDFSRTKFPDESGLQTHANGKAPQVCFRQIEVDPLSWSAQRWKLSKEKNVKT